ncbi:hypothetical protein DMENIID0001_014410 [Sergentomyia squamirostris]
MTEESLITLHGKYQKTVEIYTTVCSPLFVGLLFVGMVFCLWTVVDGTHLKDHTYLLFTLIYSFAQYQAMLNGILFIRLHKQNLNNFLEYFNFLVHTKDGRLPKIRQSVMADTIKYGIIFVRLFFFFSTLSTVIIWFYGMSYTNYSSPMFYKIPYLPEGNIFYYPANIGLQTIGLIVFVLGLVLNDTLVVVFVSYYNAEYDSISRLTLDLRSDETDVSEVLREIYSAHKKAFEQFNELKKFLWHSYLHKLVTASGYLCMIVYVLQFSAVTLAIICTSITAFYQVFMLCFIGQLNINSFEALPIKLYTTNWYDMKLVDQKNLVMILCISQYNIGIKSFGIDAISNNTFVGVVRGAASYAAILYTVLN